MFKCKQCGQGFSANPPKQCPACGAANRQPDDENSWKILGLIAFGGLTEIVIFAIVVGIVVALALKFL
ncbi:MAG: hypothetical protein AB8C95_05555 [Phycisphaeraceae bacterium]